LFHKAFYPEDIQATIVFVAPIMFGMDDPRFLQFLSLKSSVECRQRIEQFQIAVLRNRHLMLDLLRNDINSGGESYPVSPDTILEYMVVQYPYSFWQGNHFQCSDIVTPEAEIDSLFNHLCKVIPVSQYSDASLGRDIALVYQCATELGYHGFPTTHLSDLLLVLPEPRYSIFSPTGPNTQFDPEPMQTVSALLSEKGNNIIYLYGERDPWTACAVEPNSNTNAIRIIVQHTGHNFGIEDIEESDRRNVLEALNNWLGTDLDHSP
jgi:hypothetical protein